jgi:hypothetical protein
MSGAFGGDGCASGATNGATIGWLRHLVGGSLVRSRRGKCKESGPRTMHAQPFAAATSEPALEAWAAKVQGAIEGRIGSGNVVTLVRAV